MYYPEDFLVRTWAAYRAEKGVGEADVDPDDFIRWGFRRLMTHRLPRYDAIARNWGVSVEAAEIAAISAPEAFDRAIAAAIDRRAAGTGAAEAGAGADAAGARPHGSVA